ncbi:hypothetical protein HPB52_014846 [Rhipicephalus sanguineus]|uniref:Tick transposon n=1 Tax=Rhipicephalus sanguineus TaxID=34632 RepID=A0A9D4PP88_RHISA|nr:hypothetical protein HPB52_014846 [Rhipicephalus sanguineus]
MAILRPRIAKSLALSIAVALHISTAQLAELLADTFHVAPIVHDAIPAPVMPAHHRPELFAPERYFPTAAITREISALCSEDFTLASCAPTTLREPVSHATFVRYTPTHVLAEGNTIHRLPSTGINRRARAFLLRLRTGCSRTAERLFRQSGNGNPSCPQCRADETIAHILLQCPGYADHRRQLFAAYGRLGLPHVTGRPSRDDILLSLAGLLDCSSHGGQHRGSPLPALTEAEDNFFSLLLSSYLLFRPLR